MKRLKLLIVLLLLPAPLLAQHFIGCRTASGWAETPMLRTTFKLEASDFATTRPGDTIAFSISVASLGYHEVYVNGRMVGDMVLQPAVSQLDKQALRVDYDITDLVREGDNEVMLWLGQGWGRIYGTPAVVRAEVTSCHTKYYVHDESLVYAETDSTWQASPSPYSYTGSWQPLQFGGERYDARVKETWRPATIWDAGCQPEITSQEFKGNRIVGGPQPQSVDTLPDGTLLFDFGRVVTGWFQLDCLPIPEGDSITMEYLDHLDAKPPHTETDIYVSDGSGDDDIHFTNRFHMHAFRYVKVSGLEHYVAYGLDTPIATARAVQISAVDPMGGATFECSDPRLNAIHDMVKYTLSCLTFSGHMVDCPHIERMGYGGDGNSSTNTLQTLWDVRDTYHQWMRAWQDALDSTGDLPYVAPAFRTGGGPYWQGFIVKAPWRTYLNYGDPTLIHCYYKDMKRWMDYIERHTPSPLRGTPPQGGGEQDYILQPWGDTERHSWFLADWAVPDGVDKGGESVLHANSCFIAECLGDMERMARMMGLTSEANRFAARRKLIVNAIHRHFYHVDTTAGKMPARHYYANGTPLDMAYALLMGVPPDSATAAAVKAQLIKDIHGRYRDHVAFGLMGTPVFTEWCIRERQADLMATLLRQPDYPGYLNMINQGATTTWESWDCGRPDKEDRSRVHNCYNGIGIWFYQALAGIRPALPLAEGEHPEGGRGYDGGYKHFFIDPQPCSGIEWVRCTKPTQYGDIRVEINGDTLKVTVPDGTTATLFPGTPSERTLGAGQWTLNIKR